jgi:hypothetical protein
MQVPWLLQVWVAQSSMSVSQRVPLYPATQSQVKLATASEQVPPLLHGLEAQSSMFVSQVEPVYPYWQAHE